jgi:hypothetical protein
MQQQGTCWQQEMMSLEKGICTKVHAQQLHAFNFFWEANMHALMQRISPHFSSWAILQ